MNKPACPVFHVLSALSCLPCPDCHFLSALSCRSFPVRHVLSFLPCPPAISCLTCLVYALIYCHVLSAMSRPPCPVCPTLSGPVLSWSAYLSCRPCPVCPILSGPVLSGPVSSWSAYLSCLANLYERTTYPYRISGCVASLNKINLFNLLTENEPSSLNFFG
jgi:hypothetical protein